MEAWEAQRRLRKRVEELSARLSKKTGEAEEAGAAAAAANAALGRYKAEAEALGKRCAALNVRLLFFPPLPAQHLHSYIF